MAEQNSVEKVATVETLNPQEVTNIRQSIKTWNESEYRKIRASKAKEIWKKAAMEGVKP